MSTMITVDIDGVDVDKAMERVLDTINEGQGFEGNNGGFCPITGYHDGIMVESIKKGNESHSFKVYKK